MDCDTLRFLASERLGTAPALGAHGFRAPAQLCSLGTPRWPGGLAVGGFLSRGGGFEVRRPLPSAVNLRWLWRRACVEPGLSRAYARASPSPIGASAPAPRGTPSRHTFCTPWVLHAGPGAAAAACRPRSRIGCGQRAPSSRASAACAVRPDGGAYLWHEPGLRPAMRTFARRHSPGSRGGSGALFSRLVARASRSAEGARSLAAGPGGSGDDRHWRVTKSSRAPRRRSGPFVQLASYAERHCSSVKCRPRQTGEFHLARAALGRVAWPSGNRGRV